MQPTKPTPPSPGQNNPTGPGHPEINYAAPAFGHDPNGAPVHHPDYNFIMQPAQPPRPSLVSKFSLGGSLLGRVLVVLVGLVLVLAAFAVVKSLLGGNKSNGPALFGVAQQQQVLIHVSAIATQQTGTAATTQTSSATIYASISSAQRQLLTYMRLNNEKINVKQIGFKISPSQDAQLTTAAQAGNYDAIYVSTMRTILTSYEQALKQAYAQTPGPNGRTLLNNQFNGAELLVKQLGT